MTIHVAFRLTDPDNRPIAGAPLRLLVGVPDWGAEAWRTPDAGVRIITDKNGRANFQTEGVVERRWSWRPIGFTPFSWPERVHRVEVGFAVERVLPGRHGDTVHHWLYTLAIDRHPDGSSSTDDIDRLYSAGPDGRYTQLLGKAVASPQSVIMVDGFALSGAGYHVSDFAFDSIGEPSRSRGWELKLELVQTPKPVLR